MSERDWAANDNALLVHVGSGNVFVDLGFEQEEAERVVAALAEFRAKGGIRYEDFKAELDRRTPTTAPGRAGE